MTGITKDELMQIMKEAMALEVHSPHVFSDGSLRRAAHFANAILERAAVECDKKEDFYEATAIECDESGGGALWARASGSSQCAMNIRALKINIGD